MKPLVKLVSCLTLAGLFASPLAADGALRTMPHGTYECALPGIANGAAWTPVEGEHFRIASASSYRSPKGRGTYLMKGKQLIFTRGPKLGERYRRIGNFSLQKVGDDGALTPLICVRIGGKLKRR